jgi:hypothetical protein
MSSKFSRGTRGIQHPSICIPPPPPGAPTPTPPPHAKGYWCSIEGDYTSPYGSQHLSGEVQLEGDGATPQNWIWDYGAGGGPGRLTHAEVTRTKTSYDPLRYADYIRVEIWDDYHAAWPLVNQNEGDSIPTEINRFFHVELTGLQTFSGLIAFVNYP